MITILTPTFNRAHTLPRVFQSLRDQSDPRFEWVVVDDGSTDGTADLLAQFQREASFAVKAVSQPNGGKHVAVNHGVRLAEGEWVLPLDSDDALTVDAVEAIHGALAALDDDGVLGLCFRKSYFDGRLVGRPVPGTRVALHPTQASSLFGGDLAYVFRRTALESCPFPVVPGEVFFPELYVWNEIGDRGRVLFYPGKTIYLCEYLADGYSANFRRNLARNPRGFFIYYRAQIGRETRPVRRIKCLVRALQCLGYLGLKRVRS